MAVLKNRKFGVNRGEKAKGILLDCLIGCGWIKRGGKPLVNIWLSVLSRKVFLFSDCKGRAKCR